MSGKDDIVTRALAHVLLLLVFFGFAPVTASAQAQDAEPRARALYQQAQELRDDGKLTEALGRLREAYALVPSPVLLWPIAELCYRLQLPRAGLEAVRDYRRLVPAERMKPGQRVEDAERLEERLRGQVGRLQIRSEQPGALVLVNGREVGRTPLPEPVEVDPGVHRVESAGVLRPAVAVRPGEEVTVLLQKEAPAPVAPPPVQARAAAARPAPRPRPRPRAVSWVLAGVTGASLLSGAILGGVTLGKRAELLPHCPGGSTCVPDMGADIGTLNQQASDLAAYGKASVALLGIGAGLLAVTTVVAVLDLRSQRRGVRLGLRLRADGPVLAAGGGP